MTRPTLIHGVGTCLLISLLAFGAACGGDDDDTETAGQTGTARIVIENFAFLGIDSTAANVPFTVENKDEAPHTVTSVDNKFPVWSVGPGETKTFGSLRPGTYAIRCDLHPAQMTGRLIVK